MSDQQKNTADEVIEDDEIIEEVEEGSWSAEDDGEQNFLKKYGRWILLGVAVLGVGVIFLVFRSSKRSQNNITAQKEMIHANQIYDQVVAGQGAPDTLLITAINGQGGFKGFAGIISSYSGTEAANLSHYYVGTAYLRLGQLNEGIEELEKFKKGDNLVSCTAYGALGAAYEDKKDWEKAIKNYELAAETPGENSHTTPYYLMAAGRAYESSGNKEKAVECYKKIKESYPNSAEAGSVDKYLGRATGGKLEE